MNLEKLEIQLDFLRDDLLNFEINPHYAVRIATLIRIMVHDTTKPNGEPGSISLLTHLNLKQKFLFLNSCEALGKMSVDNFSDKNIGTDISKEKYMEINSFRGLTAEQNNGSEIKLIPFFKHLQAGGFNTDEHILKSYQWVSFDEWWRAIIFRSSNGTEADRSFLTLKAANKDGGTHYDSSLPQKYISTF